MKANQLINNLNHKRKMLLISLTSAQSRINTLGYENDLLTLKVNAEQAINYTHWFIHALGFIGFGWVAVSLRMMVTQ